MPLVALFRPIYIFYFPFAPSPLFFHFILLACSAFHLDTYPTLAIWNIIAGAFPYNHAYAAEGEHENAKIDTDKEVTW